MRGQAFCMMHMFGKLCGEKYYGYLHFFEVSVSARMNVMRPRVPSQTCAPESAFTFSRPKAALARPTPRGSASRENLGILGTIALPRLILFVLKQEFFCRCRSDFMVLRPNNHDDKRFVCTRHFVLITRPFID